MVGSKKKTFGKRGRQVSDASETARQQPFERSRQNRIVEQETASKSGLFKMVLGFLFSFRGRATRLEYWCFFLVYGAAYAFNKHIYETLDRTDPNLVLGILLAFFGIIILLIHLAVSVRRYHDRGKSGWWYLIILIPIIGPIWMIIELGFLSGDPGSNQYG